MEMPDVIYAGFKCSPSAWAHTRYWSKDIFPNEDMSLEKCNICDGNGCKNCVNGFIPSAANKYHHDRIVEALRKELDDALKNYEIILNLYNKKLGRDENGNA